MRTGLLIFGIVLIFSCGEPLKVYMPQDPKRTLHYTLSESEYSSLKNYLQSKNSSPLKDTLIVHYHFYKDNCWSLIDRNTKDEINNLIASRNKYVTDVLSQRNNLSVFQFREPGNHPNTLIYLNKQIKIDSSTILKTILFRNKTTCGSSALVLPDREVWILRSDAHYEILRFFPPK